MNVLTQFAAASAAFVLLAGAAQAANFEFSYTPFFVARGVVATMVDRPPSMIDDGMAGAFHGKLSNALGFSLLSSASPLMAGVGFTFCVELTQQVVFGLNPAYSIIDPVAGNASWGASAAGISTHPDKLMSLALPSVAAAADAEALRTSLGALQLSLWEVIYDFSPSYDYSWTSGTLKFNIAQAVLAQSAAWLATAAMASVAPTAHYQVLSSANSQDLLVVAVPEPSSTLLMALGGAAVASFGALRKRKLTRTRTRACNSTRA
jgi:hypothetical protein